MRDPIGFSARRLSAGLHAVTADEAPLRNLLVLIERCYAGCDGLVAAPYASALAVTTATRSHALPDLPTVADFVPGYEASTWNGVCAPKNTPVEIVDRLNREINAGLADPKINARLAEVGASAFSGFARRLRQAFRR